MKKVQGYWIILLFCVSLHLYGQVPDWQWARAIHTIGHEHAIDVTADPVTGNIYIAGAWRNDLSAYFPGNSYPGTDFSSTYGGEDGLVVKYDQNGTILWAFKIGGSGDDEVSAITLDSSGNFYITGYIDDGTNYFSGTSSSTLDSTIYNSSGLDFFIAKYNPDGALLWVRHSDGSSGDAKGLGIYAENSSVFASGHCTGSTSFGPFSGTFNQGNEDYFVAKYDVNGNEQWLLEGGSDRSDFAHDVLSDGTNLYFVGSYEGDTLSVLDTSGTKVDSIANVSSGKTDIFILSFDVNSNYNWGRKISSDEDDAGYGITHDADSLYITGGISNFANFPEYINNPVIVSYKMDIFISSHSKTNGNTGWVRVVTCTNNGDEEGLDIVIDITQSIYITGYFSQEINFFGDTTISSFDFENIFVASFLDNGTFNWAKIVESSGAGDIGYGISTDNLTNIYIAGQYNQLAIFDTITLPVDGGHNIFLANIELTCNDAEGGTGFTAQDHICLSESATISLTGYYGVIQWQSSPYGLNNWTDISGENIPKLVVSPNDTTDFRAFLTIDPCQPDSSNTITIYVFELPQASISGNTLICEENSANLKVELTGDSPWNLEYSDGVDIFSIPGINSSPYFITVNQFSTTTYYLVSVGDVHGCNGTVSGTATVNVDEQPAANAGSGGDECDLDYALQATPSVGTGAWTKTSGPGTETFTPDATTPYATVTVDAYGTYEFTWTEFNGICSNDSTITVNFYEPPVADAGQDISLCSGEESELNASEGVTYSWSPETGLSNSNIADPIVNPTTTTLYTLTITDINGCSDQNTVKVTVNPLPDIEVGEDKNICVGETVLLQAYGEGTFNWNHPDMLSNSNIPNPVASPNVTTTFEVILTDQNNCENFESIIVFVFKQPAANAGPDQELDYVFETMMEAELTSSESGEWSVISGAGNFGNKNSHVSVVTGLSPGDNIFIWKVTNGVCPETTDEVKITVNDLFVPSVITPNGDNKNDYFVIRGIGNFNSSELIVFNRWGAEVYKNENYKNDWNGRDHNGNELPDDTYFFILNIKNVRIIKGYVVIRR